MWRLWFTPTSWDENPAFQIRSSWGQLSRFERFQRLYFSITYAFSTPANVPTSPCPLQFFVDNRNARVGLDPQVTAYVLKSFKTSKSLTLQKAFLVARPSVMSIRTTTPIAVGSLMPSFRVAAAARAVSTACEFVPSFLGVLPLPQMIVRSSSSRIRKKLDAPPDRLRRMPSSLACRSMSTTTSSRASMGVGEGVLNTAPCAWRFNASRYTRSLRSIGLLLSFSKSTVCVRGTHLAPEKQA